MKVFILGTGNVAKTLGAAVKKAGHQITGVYGRTEKSADRVADHLKCPSFSDLSAIPPQSDIYIIAVNDKAISDIAKQIIHVKGIIVHTSGSTSIRVLQRKIKSGVLYPVETITTKFPASFNTVPLCIEASEEKTLKTLITFANTLSGKIYVLTSDQRAILHVAAVFANNFTNHLLGIATAILDREKLPHELLERLTETTVKNAFGLGPANAQTGPAKRDDTDTIKRHLSYLLSNKDYVDIYKIITRQIKAVHKKTESSRKKS